MGAASHRLMEDETFVPIRRESRRRSPSPVQQDARKVHHSAEHQAQMQQLFEKYGMAKGLEISSQPQNNLVEGEGPDVIVLPDEVLGSGSFGTVRKGIYCGIPVSVKSFQQRHGEAEWRMVAAFANELRILWHLQHSNIVFIHGAMVDIEQQSIALVVELVQDLTVPDFMGVGSHQQDLPDPCSRYQVCLGVCRAVFYLHARRPSVVHGDLKSIHVLVEGSGRNTKPKLLDFGRARVLTHHVKPLGGPPSWMAQEVLSRTEQRPRCSADIFSLVMLLHFIATRAHAWRGMSRSLIKHVLRSGQLVPLDWPPDSTVQPYCKTLVESCLPVEEHLRPSAWEVHAATSAGGLPTQAHDTISCTPRLKFPGFVETRD